MSSGTRSPAATMSLTSRPSGVPAAISARSISPVDRWATSKCSPSRRACVPLPDAGAPSMSSRTARPSTRRGIESIVGARPVRRSAAVVRPGAGDVDTQQDPAFTLHRGAVVVPVVVLAGHPPVVVDEPVHRGRQRDDLYVALD